MEEHMNKEEIMDKAIQEFQETTGKMIPHFCEDLDALKLLMQSIMKYSFAYKDIVWTNKLRLVGKEVKEYLKRVEASDIELLCNWNPQFQREVKNTIEPIVAKARKR